jgi:3-oxoacyl-[acyl-carrier-protein] synthase-3
MKQPLPIGIAAIGMYLPAETRTAVDIAHMYAIPEHVVVEKMGIQRTYVAGPDDMPSQMAARAAHQALVKAQVSPDELDLIIYHGSEFKDYVVWSAAAKIQHAIGASKAYAYEIYALCAGTPVALKSACDQMRGDPRLGYVLLVSAACENNLVHPQNPNTRFMANFSAGGSAILLRRGDERNQVLESSILVDGSFSENVVMPGGGCRNPTTAETVSQGLHMLDVQEMDDMRDRLGAISLPNFARVIDEAVQRSGASRSDIAFLIVTHMKRSFHLSLLQELGLHPDQALYLEEFGHIQSVDQPLGLSIASERGLIHDGDLVVVAGAGTGYTWGATAIRWGYPPLLRVD